MNQLLIQVACTVTYMIKQHKDKAIWISQLLSGFTGLSFKEILLPKWMRTMCNIGLHWRHETVDSNTSFGELCLHVWDLKSYHHFVRICKHIWSLDPTCYILKKGCIHVVPRKRFENPDFEPLSSLWIVSIIYMRVFIIYTCHPHFQLPLVSVEDKKLANQDKLFHSWTSVKWDSSLREVQLPTKWDSSF